MKEEILNIFPLGVNHGGLFVSSKYVLVCPGKLWIFVVHLLRVFSAVMLTLFLKKHQTFSTEKINESVVYIFLFFSAVKVLRPILLSEKLIKKL